MTTLIVDFDLAFMRICQHSANFAVSRTQLVPSESAHIRPSLCTDVHEDARPHGERLLVSLFLVVKISKRAFGFSIREGASLRRRILQAFFAGLVSFPVRVCVRHRTNLSEDLAIDCTEYDRKLCL